MQTGQIEYVTMNAKEVQNCHAIQTPRWHWSFIKGTLSESVMSATWSLQANYHRMCKQAFNASPLPKLELCAGVVTKV